MTELSIVRPVYKCPDKVKGESEKTSNVGVFQVGRTGHAKTQMHEKTQHLWRTVNLK